MTIHQSGFIRSWWRDMREGVVLIGNGVTEFTKGALIDTPQELFYFGPDVTRYVLGVDKQLGEGRDKNIGQVVTGVWKSYDWAEASPFNNPIAGPVMRLADVGAGMAYGLADMVLGHYPHKLFNETWGLNLPYLSPAPATSREAGRDAGMAALLAARPGAKTTARSALGMGKKPIPVHETPAAKFFPNLERTAERARQVRQAEQQRPAWAPSPFVFGMWTTVEGAVRWFEEWKGRVNDSIGLAKKAAQEKILKVDAKDIEVLAREAGSNPDALRILVELRMWRHEGAKRAFAKVLRSHRDFVISEITKMAETGSWTAVSCLLDLVKEGEAGAIDPLIRMAEKNPTEMIEVLCEAVESVPDSIRQILVEQMENMRIDELEKLARTNQDDATLDLIRLSEFNEAAYEAMCELDPSDLVRQVIEKGDWEAAYALTQLSDNMNGNAMEAIRSLNFDDLAALARRAQTDAVCVEVLADLAKEGSAYADVELRRLALIGTEEVQEMARSILGQKDYPIFYASTSTTMDGRLSW